MKYLSEKRKWKKQYGSSDVGKMKKKEKKMKREQKEWMEKKTEN